MNPAEPVSAEIAELLDGCTVCVVFTSQLDFPDEVRDEVLASAPYADRPGRDTTNSTDEILPTGGTPAVLDITPAGNGYGEAICLVLPDPVNRDGGA